MNEYKSLTIAFINHFEACNTFCSQENSTNRPRLSSLSSLRKCDHILAAIYTYIHSRRHTSLLSSASSLPSVIYIVNYILYCYRYCYPRPHHLSRQHRLRQPRLKSSTEVKEVV